MLGAGATIATRAQPGQVLGGCIVIGTVAAALTVRPRAGRLIFPVPAISYLIAALVAGIVYNRSTSKTALVIGATQWIADGFFLMALATVLAIAVITARWYLEKRGGRGQAVPDRPGPADRTSPRSRQDRDEHEATGDRGTRGTRGTRGAAPPLSGRQDLPGGPVGPGGSGGYAAPRPSPPRQGPRPQGSAGPDQRGGPHPGQFSGGPFSGGQFSGGQDYGSYPEARSGHPSDRRGGSPYDQQPRSGSYDGQSGPYDRQSGSGPYNFSSGA